MIFTAQVSAQVAAQVMTNCTCTPTVNPFPWLPGTAIIVDKKCPVHGGLNVRKDEREEKANEYRS